MPARKARRRKKKASEVPVTFRRGLVVAIAVAAVLAGAVGWLRTDDGRLALADRGLTATDAWTRDRFESAVLQTLAGLGVPADSIVVEPSEVDGPTVVRFGTDLDLTHLNLALTVALEDVGATVHQGRRSEDEDGEQLELRLGTRPRLTHRVLAHVGRVAPPPLPMPDARVALVIDDLGNNFNALTRRALALPQPITFAVLPGLVRTRRVLTEIERSGHEAFLHLPMEAEPSSGYDAGEPQIRVGMAPDAVRSAVESSLAQVGSVSGVNNHMGSRATRSRPEMDVVMGVLAERGLVFLDSQTTPRSVAHVAAAASGVPTLRNDIFLDANKADAALVAERFEKLVRIATSRGWAIGIAHVNEPTVSVLEQVLPTLEARGVALVPVSELIHERNR